MSKYRRNNILFLFSYFYIFSIFFLSFCLYTYIFQRLYDFQMLDSLLDHSSQNLVCSWLCLPFENPSSPSFSSSPRFQKQKFILQHFSILPKVLENFTHPHVPPPPESGGDDHYAVSVFLIKFQDILLNMLDLEWVTVIVY